MELFGRAFLCMPSHNELRIPHNHAKSGLTLIDSGSAKILLSGTIEANVRVATPNRMANLFSETSLAIDCRVSHLLPTATVYGVRRETRPWNNFLNLEAPHGDHIISSLPLIIITRLWDSLIANLMCPE